MGAKDIEAMSPDTLVPVAADWVKEAVSMEPEVYALEVDETPRPVPVVKELATMAPAFPVVEGAVTDRVPLDTARLPSPSTVSPATVEAALESKPEVMVTAPEMVGVAVQAVGLMVKVVPAFPREVEVELAVPRFNASAESTARMPEVAVCMVRLPDVLVQAEVPPEAIVRAPVELPMLVAAVPVALMLVVPVTVIPPVP